MVQMINHFLDVVFEASACDDVCLAGVREGLANWRGSVTEEVSAD